MCVICCHCRVQLKEGNPKSGRAWGVLYWRGQAMNGGAEKEVRSSLKKQWVPVTPSARVEKATTEAAAAAEAQSGRATQSASQ